MKKIKESFLINLAIIILTTNLFTACSEGKLSNQNNSSTPGDVKPSNQPNSSTETPGDLKPSDQPNPSTGKQGAVKLQEERFSDENKIENPKIPEKEISSGATIQVPWENVEAFKVTQQKIGALKLMAAYRTVLKNPLPGEEYNVQLAAKYLVGTVIKPGETFSQNNKIGPYVEKRGFQRGPTYNGSKLVTTIGGGVCKIASTLYNVVILSNLEVVERHNHSMPVPYVPYGQDATVSYGVNDFKFKNNTNAPILIWAQSIDNILYIGFYSKNMPPKVSWNHEITNIQKAPTIYRTNFSLPKGSEVKVEQGLDGATVKSWVTIENSNGTKTQKQLGKSYYKPFPTIVEKGQ